jgi:hypothetical protein
MQPAIIGPCLSATFDTEDEQRIRNALISFGRKMEHPKEKRMNTGPGQGNL